MSILVYIENDGATVKKSSFEAASYAGSFAQAQGTSVVAVSPSVISDEALSELGKYGVSVIKKVDDPAFNEGNTQVIASSLQALAGDSDLIVMSHSSVSEGVCARLAVKLGASVATNVIGLPDTADGFVVKRSIYTSKAFSTSNLTKEKKVITVKKNSFELVETGGTATIETVAASSTESDLKVKILETKKQEGDILLPEADLVVSAGRGLKGPENWGMIEDLAKVLGAATACSKPVSDVGWRPHHEHVGQTGIKVSPNLYIAIGISGAIQHLAGVSSSKVIVAINIDPEAPFFKAADYGIVGDAFDVVPKLVDALKAELG